MVLGGLVQSLHRLLKNICEATSMVSSCGREISSSTPSTTTPTPTPTVAMEVSCSDDRVSQVVSVEDRTPPLPGNGFMGAARQQPSVVGSRNLSSKRKLDEFDGGCAELPGNAQVRPRREAESSGWQGRLESTGLQQQQQQQVDVNGVGGGEDGNTNASEGARYKQEIKEEGGGGGGGGGDPDIVVASGREYDDGEDSSAEEEDEFESDEEGDGGGGSGGGGSGGRDMDVELLATSLQFFVKTYIDGRTLVVHATPWDTVESIYQQIHARTGLPIMDQRLIYCGRQLQNDQTLEQCAVAKDSTLNLVGRMRSTALPHSWQLINDLVSTIRKMCNLSGDQVNRLGSRLSHCQDTVRNGVQEFLKMASKSVPIAEHMQVFLLSGATSALVMLLLSPVDSNRSCALDSIEFFLTNINNEEYVSHKQLCHCAPVLLDFCKLLARSAPTHGIYPTCRTALARLLDTTMACFNDMKAEPLVGDLSPFVRELAESLMTHLQDYNELPMPEFTSSMKKEAKDFAAFIAHLCRAVSMCPGIFAETILDECWDEDCRVAEESCRLGWLVSLFNRLLAEVDKCLQALVEDEDTSGREHVRQEERPYARAPFLYLLKGLHAVGNLLDRAKARLILVLENRRVALNLLIQQSRDDDSWLLEYRSVLDFDSKKRLVTTMLPEPQDDHDERQELIIRRANLLQDSLEQLVYVDAENIHGGISVEFATEEATGPGVLREWFFMVCKQLFNPENALFVACPNDRKRFYPNPASGVNPGHLTYFKFCGRVLALAVMHRVQIDVTFASFFFKMLAGLNITWEDAKDADPFLYSSCKAILEMDADEVDSDALALTFVTEVDILGSRKTLELCPNGANIPVTSANRREFVDLLVRRRLVGSVQEQVKQFSEGFGDLLLVKYDIRQFLGPLDLVDLDMIIYGTDRDLSVEDWKLHTEYHDYDVSDREIQWFWQVVESMTVERQRKLLFFATSITHLPPEGFKGLASKFHIHKAFTEVALLPTAHTCFYQLILPEYKSLEEMTMSLYAITTDHVAEGFGFA